MQVAPRAPEMAERPPFLRGTQRAVVRAMQQNPYQALYNPPQGYPQGQQGNMGYQQPMIAQGDYEFSSDENAVIGSTASWTRGAGIIQIVVGALAAIGGILGLASGNPGSLVNLIAAAVCLSVGIALTSAGGSLNRVVITEGGDIMHMMQAMRSYQRAFKVQVITVILAIVLGVILAMAVSASAR